MSTLLGKRLLQPIPIIPKRPNRLKNLGILGLLLLACGGAYFATPQLFPSLNRAPLVNRTQFFADFSPNELATVNLNGSEGSVLGATTDTPPCAFFDKKQNPTPLKIAFNAKTIFPILPSAVLTGKDNAGVETNCTPPYWNLDIFRVLLYKGLGLLNYVIEVAAIIMTLYAGILYISGFANEKNVATAKTILIATYAGLALSLSATLILRTTIGVFADQQTTDAINQNQEKIFNGQ